jgi:LacI family transcriptional regulator
LEVPGQVSVVGFDDLPPARWPLLQLTTVAFDLDAMARRAASLLVQRIEDGPEAPYRHERFPSRLVERATLAAPS